MELKKKQLESQVEQWSQCQNIYDSDNDVYFMCTSDQGNCGE